MRNFKQPLICKKGSQRAVKSCQTLLSFPKKKKTRLSSQIINAAVSTPTNIAEGSSRDSMKDYYRFLEISLGSSFKLET
jgi:four helix bundle protein